MFGWHCGAARNILKPMIQSCQKIFAARAALLFVVLSTALGYAAAPEPAESGHHIIKLNIDGTINPAVDDYLAQGLEYARQKNAAAVLIQINTPGGLLESTRSIVQKMLNADIPIIVWVAPPGARAASAGMFITMAGHLAFMAPGTNIGAATPISSGGKDVQQEGGEDLARKIMQDTRAFARSIAEVRDRPVEWMEDAVTRATSITSDEALEKRAIDGVASTEDELLAAADGRSVKVNGNAVTVTTAGATVEPVGMRPGQQLMHYLAHPNIAYLLMLLGMLGIYFELSQPGGFIAGVLGTIALLLAFISMQVLPFRTGGLLLILLSIVMFVAEVFVPSLGILAAGGFVSFVVGSLILFNTPEMDLQLDPMLIAGATAAFGTTALAIGYLVVRSQGHPQLTGTETMIGATARSLTVLDPDGKVFIRGEIWNARALDNQPIDKDVDVTIVEMNGLNLTVQAAAQTQPPESEA